MKKIFLISIIIINILLLAGFVFLVVHIHNTVIETRVTKERFAEEQQKIRQIESLRIVVKDLGSTEKILNSLYIEENRIVDFIKELEVLASQKSVSLVISHLDVIKEKQPYVSFGIDFRGARDDVVSALHAFELLPYLIFVDQVFVTPVESRDGIPGGWRLGASGRLTSFIPQAE
jgi:hypothetical protein